MAQATQQQDKINRFLVYKSNDDGHGIRLDNKKNSNNIENNNDICNKLLPIRNKIDDDGLGMTITAKSKKKKWRGQEAKILKEAAEA